jgi:HKD family nuclease
MKLLKGNWELTFKQLLAESKSSVMIISPFVTMRAYHLLRPYLENRQLSCKLITRLNLNDFVSGVSNPKALCELAGVGAEVKSLRGLHAKVYLFDDKWAVVTSANMTAGGLKNRHEWGLLYIRA